MANFFFKKDNKKKRYEGRDITTQNIQKLLDHAEESGEPITSELSESEKIDWGIGHKYKGFYVQVGKHQGYYKAYAKHEREEVNYETSFHTTSRDAGAEIYRYIDGYKPIIIKKGFIYARA